jgi:hypothetical protein
MYIMIIWHKIEQRTVDFLQLPPYEFASLSLNFKILDAYAKRNNIDITNLIYYVNWVSTDYVDIRYE